MLKVGDTSQHVKLFYVSLPPASAYRSSIMKECRKKEVRQKAGRIWWSNQACFPQEGVCRGSLIAAFVMVTAYFDDGN